MALCNGLSLEGVANKRARGGFAPCWLHYGEDQREADYGRIWSALNGDCEVGRRISQDELVI
jgi:hypothetical protein